MSTAQRLAAWGAFVLAVVSVIYGVADYSFHPDLKGHSSILLSGAMLGGVQLYASWMILRDDQTDRQYRSELARLSERIKQLQEQMARRSRKRTPPNSSN